MKIAVLAMMLVPLLAVGLVIVLGLWMSEEKESRLENQKVEDLARLKGWAWVLRLDEENPPKS